MSGTAAYRSYAVELPGRAAELAGTSFSLTEESERSTRGPMAERRQEKRRQRGNVEDLPVFTEEGSFFFSQACRAFTAAKSSSPLPEGTPFKSKGSKPPPRYLRPGKLRHLLNSSSAVRSNSSSLRWPIETPSGQDAGAIVVVQEARNPGTGGAQTPRDSTPSSQVQTDDSRGPAAPSEALSGALVTIDESGAEAAQQQVQDGAGSPAVGGANRGHAPGGSPGPHALQPGSALRPHQNQQLQAGHLSVSPLYNPPPVNKRQRKHFALCSPFQQISAALSPLGQALVTQRPSPLVLRSPALGLVTPPPSTILSLMAPSSSAHTAAAPASLDGLPFDVLVSTGRTSGPAFLKVLANSLHMNLPVYCSFGAQRLWHSVPA